MMFGRSADVNLSHPRRGTFQGMPRSNWWAAACTSPAASVVPQSRWTPCPECPAMRIGCAAVGTVGYAGLARLPRFFKWELCAVTRASQVAMPLLALGPLKARSPACPADPSEGSEALMVLPAPVTSSFEVALASAVGAMGGAHWAWQRSA